MPPLEARKAASERWRSTASAASEEPLVAFVCKWGWLEGVEDDDEKERRRRLPAHCCWAHHNENGERNRYGNVGNVRIALEACCTCV